MARLISVSLLISLLGAGLCAGRTITVDANGTGDYPTIQAAIDDANDGDIIELLPGTYTGDGNRDIEFLGKAITVRSVDPLDPSVVAATVVDCNGIDGDEHRGFLFHADEGNDSVIAGLTIRNGFSDYSQYDSGGWGGGIYCCSNPTISYCVIANNSAIFGGGVCCSGGDPIIEYCIIEDNSAGKGGGIYCTNATNSTISHCVIKNNSAQILSYVNFSGNGGGIGSTIGGLKSIVSNCIFSGNTAERRGGGIYISYRTVHNCVFYGNLAENSGGGIYSSTSATVTNCILWNNVGEFGTYLTSQISGDYKDIKYCCIQGWNEPSDDGNIGADPCFVDPVGGDFHIQGTSPCIDSANPAYWPLRREVDLDGEPRVMGGRLDMGVDEVTAELIPVMVVLSSDLSFGCKESRSNPGNQILTIGNIGAGALNWQITEDCPWLDVEPAGGSCLLGESNDVIVSVDAAGLSAGSYACNLTVSDLDAVNSPRTINVTLFVQGPILDISPPGAMFI